MMAAVLLMQSFASLVVSALALILLVTIGKNAGLRDNNDHSSAAVVVDKLWRFLIGLGAVPAALALFYRLTMPESPRWTLDVADDHRAAHDMRLYEYSPANIMESEYDDSIQLPQRRQEMAQVTDIEIVMGSLHRRSTISVPDSAIASVHSQRDFESEVEPQQISERDDIESAGGNEELPFPFSLSIPHALKRFFLIDGNWRSLTAIALCAFFINAAMSGLGGDNYRILAQVWSATSSHVNSTVPAYSDGQVNAPIAGSQIYETLYNLALHSIIVLSAGSFVGGAILIKIVDHLNRKQLLATGSLLIAPVLLVIFGILISDSVAGINAVKIVLYAICYFVFNLGSFTCGSTFLKNANHQQVQI
jgi:PHS family inorganic phosphate transporter-like MFS transporter